MFRDGEEIGDAKKGIFWWQCWPTSRKEKVPWRKFVVTIYHGFEMNTDTYYVLMYQLSYINVTMKYIKYDMCYTLTILSGIPWGTHILQSFLLSKLLPIIKQLFALFCWAATMKLLQECTQNRHIETF